MNMNNEPEQLSTLCVDGETRPKALSKWIVVRCYIGAFFIYIIYWGTLFGAIRNVAGATFSPKEAGELVEEGVIDSIWEYGWGDHYILFLIAFCFVTFCCAVLAGATAKKKGAIVASIANLPIIVLASVLCYFLYVGTTNVDIKSPITWKVILPLSIFGSMFFSIIGGSVGEKWQNNMFKINTILGIRPLHWWWLIFPLNLVVQALVPRVMATLALLVVSTFIRETKYSVLFFLMFVAFATFIYFIIWGWYKTFRLLSTGRRTNLSRCRIALSVLLYLFGIPLLFEVFCILVFILGG